MNWGFSTSRTWIGFSLHAASQLPLIAIGPHDCHRTLLAYPFTACCRPPNTSHPPPLLFCSFLSSSLPHPLYHGTYRLTILTGWYESDLYHFGQGLVWVWYDFEWWLVQCLLCNQLIVIQNKLHIWTGEIWKHYINQPWYDKLLKIMTREEGRE